MPEQQAQNGTQRRVERISQSVISVTANRDGNAFNPVRRILLAWLQEKAGRELSKAMMDGENDSFDVLGAQRVETVSINEPRLWAARQDFQDQTVPRRTWVTEAMLASSDIQNVLLGFRLHCVTLGEPAPFSRSIPRFMRQVARTHIVRLDGIETDLTAQAVDTPDETRSLLALLTDVERKVPVIGISTDVTSDGELSLIDANRLANEVFAVGHVRLLSRSASFALTDALGKRFSTFSGAVRIWWPNMQIEQDDPYDHPLWLADRIRADTTRSIFKTIVDRVLRSSAGRRDAENAIPSFAEVRRAAATFRREKAVADNSRAADDILPLYEAENLRLLEEIKELRSEHAELLALADEDRQGAVADRDAARSEIYVLRARVAEMENALRSKEQKPDVHIPDTFEKLEAWSKIHVENTTILLPRALNSAKKSLFENPALAYRALLLLHEVYVPMRRSGSQALKDRWDSALRQLGLECSPTHSSTRAGENASDYFVTYEGRRMEIDMHLKGSSSRDPRYCFRLYFFWSESDRRVVVAWLPSHLDTRIT